MDTSTQLRDPLLQNEDDAVFGGNHPSTSSDTNNQQPQQQQREQRIRQLRWITIGSSTVTLILELISLPGRILLFLLYPAKTILTIYLIGFCVLIIASELIPDNYQIKLKDNIGILYHPFGRGMLLLIMAGMCCGVLGSSMWESIIVFPTLLLCGIGHIYCYFRYKDYFQQDEDFSGNFNNTLSFQEHGGGPLMETDPTEIIQESFETARSNALSWAIRSHISNMMNNISNNNNQQQGEDNQQQEQESQSFMQQDIVS